MPAAEVYRLLELGQELNHKGRSDEAVKMYRKALDLEPQFERAHYAIGVALAKAEQVDEAAGHYRQVLKADPQHAKAHNNLGAILLDQGHLEEATAHYRAAGDIESANAHTTGTWRLFWGFAAR